MENLTIADPMEGGAVAGRPGLVVASGSGGSSGNDSSTVAAVPRSDSRRIRIPGRWKRIPRCRETILPRSEPAVMVRRGGLTLPPSPPREARPWNRKSVLERSAAEVAEMEAWATQDLLRMADELEQRDDDGCDTEEAKVAFRAFKVKFAAVYRELASTDTLPVRPVVARPTDTQEEHLTAEEMEMKADCSGWLLCPQARHFSMLALEHYNSTKKMHKFELGRVLLSKCFSEVDGSTFAHVNFTATPKHSPKTKRLFFAELMLIPDLQAYEGAEPMRVLHVCTIDDDSCFGGCHEIEREIKEPVRKNLDYDRCHACSDRIKHPRGSQFIAGHDCTRMQYVSAFAWTYRK